MSKVEIIREMTKWIKDGDEDTQYDTAIYKYIRATAIGIRHLVQISKEEIK